MQISLVSFKLLFSTFLSEGTVKSFQLAWRWRCYDRLHYRDVLKPINVCQALNACLQFEIKRTASNLLNAKGSPFLAGVGDIGTYMGWLHDHLPEWTHNELSWEILMLKCIRTVLKWNSNDHPRSKIWIFKRHCAVSCAEAPTSTRQNSFRIVHPRTVRGQRGDLIIKKNKLSR